MASRQKSSTQRRLERELQRLQTLAPGLPHALKVTHMPSIEKPLHGEVKGQEILVYDSDDDEALRTLRHEVMDILVSEAIAPYRELTNAIIKALNEEAYKRKERTISSLLSLWGM